jgi:hypothetical protein
MKEVMQSRRFSQIFVIIVALGALSSVAFYSPHSVLAQGAQGAPAEPVIIKHEGLPDPGILPTSPFYFIKRLGEGIKTFFTFGSGNKAARHFELAQKRLAEAEALVAEKKFDQAKPIFARYEKELEATQQFMEKAELSGSDMSKLAEKILTILPIKPESQPQQTAAELTPQNQPSTKEPQKPSVGELPPQKQPLTERAKTEIQQIQERAPMAAQKGLETAESRLQKAAQQILERRQTAGAMASGDFTACSGIDSSERERVAYHRILLAKSNDGLHFTRLNKVISDRASVPEVITDKDGNVRVYFIQVACKEKNMRNNPVVAISKDGGNTWSYKRLNIEAPSEAPQCKEPGGNPPPVDPDVVLMPDGTYRLYATCPKGTSGSGAGGGAGFGAGTGAGAGFGGGGAGSGQIPMTFVFFSNDGINFKDAKPTYVPKGKRALDPVTLKTASEWHLFNGDEKGGTLHAVSQDGITFTEREQFCPFKYTNAKGSQRCYIVGDAIALGDGRYRIYLFINEAEGGGLFKSIISSDGENWKLEQGENEYVLKLDSNSQSEYYELASPSVARLRDGSFLMAYETAIPGTPSSVFSVGGGQIPGGMMQSGGQQPGGMMQQQGGSQPRGMMQQGGQQQFQQPGGMQQFQQPGDMMQPGGMQGGFQQPGGMMQQPGGMMQPGGTQQFQQPGGMMQPGGMQQFPPPGGMQGGGYCGDGTCQDIERQTGGCPSDCLQLSH